MVEILRKLRLLYKQLHLIVEFRLLIKSLIPTYISFTSEVIATKLLEYIVPQVVHPSVPPNRFSMKILSFVITAR
jgi:hypothetical protein